MPYLQGTDASSESALVPLGKLQRRFYEPLVLLLAVTQACMHNHAQKVSDSLTEVLPHSQDELFKNFVNKLCQICDNKPRGSTVTSISVLQYPDRVQYRFASNQRSEGDLLEVRSYLRDILETLKDYSASSSTLLVLRKVIAFNRPRLQIYVRHLSEQTQKCLGMSNVHTMLSDKLEELRDLAVKADDREMMEDEFFNTCINLMLFIRELSKSPIHRSLQEKASSHTGSGEPSPWAELRHSAGRLLSYFQASKTLIEARKKWDPLFHEFEVEFVRSSTLAPNPINNKRVNAEIIIGRMLSGEARIQAYRADVEELQKFDLDLNITEQVTKTTFKPLVHAEVLIHQSMLDEFGPNGPRSSQFFSQYRYIGSSKPTCRLCDYYFAASASGIDVRETHRNLYINWRVPYVYSHQGEAAIKRRERILDRILERVRADTLRTLSEKVPERKTHDSNTEPTFPALNHGTSVGFDDGGLRDTNLDDVAASMCQLDVRDSSREETPEVRSESPPSRAGSGFDADDDDDGGARLW